MSTPVEQQTLAPLGDNVHDIVTITGTAGMFFAKNVLQGIQIFIETVAVPEK